MSFGRTSFEPAQQGDLDGFCGIYAGYNFFCRRLNIKPDSKRGEKIFKRLLTLLDGQGKLTVHRICDGFGEGQLQKAFNKIAEKEELDLKVWKLSVYAKKHKPNDVFELVASLDSDEAAMIHMDKQHHWVLAHSGTAKQFTVDDSSREPEPQKFRSNDIKQYGIKMKDGLVFLNV